MTTNELYDELTDAISAIIPDEWTIVRLNAQFLSDGQEVELDGTYLTTADELEVLPTNFPDEVIEAIQELHQQHKTNGGPRANKLQIDLTAQGQLTADFSWDQEIQDEDDHFSNGGTAKQWTVIRQEKYGATDEATG